MIWTISESERELAFRCMDRTLKAGADAVRITLCKSMMDLVSLRDGETDKVTHSGDRSLTFCIFAGGSYGTFSTNRLDEDHLERFIQEAVRTAKMLAPDPLRRLPDPSRLCRDAVTGMEAGLFDPAYGDMTPLGRLSLAREASFRKKARPEGYGIISEETEYSDSVYDMLVIDSQGLEARHTETSFELGCEYTIEDGDAHKLSGYWWDASPRLEDLKVKDVCPAALQRAVAQIGSGTIPSGKYTMVVENEVASRLVTPLLSALGGSSLQQNNSFLTDSLGKKVFSGGFTLMDIPRSPGENGARFFDSEGVTAENTPVISEGVVKRYFLNTYTAGKMGMDPTVEDCMRASVRPYWGFPGSPSQINADSIMRSCREGILVTGFNGGNCNSATGDFSYGIEGFHFRDGKLSPVHGMVATGNMLTLWNNLLAAGTDLRPCMNRQVPTLAFAQVDFSS